ncbi:glycosyltransferase [Rhabdochromatium marinum]|uniref:glycosyltransferase n=1 Tax=Rhabdochromatium marinum TaxID=48729 RepID=UPI001905C250|nr:glycosyltransferase [Rhabdochromatium marinum]MBK1649457.1 glycosyl transferase family 1 [Rhabdochromatium marinum]
MRVLMISDVYFPRVNGVSTSIQTFAREFAAAGHEVTLIAPDYGEQSAEPFAVIRIASHYLPFDPEDRVLRWGRLRACRASLADAGFDLVHVHTPFLAHYAGLALARHLEVPVIESYHTFFEQYLDKYVPLVPGAWLRYAARRFSTSQCQRVDALAVPSQAMLKVLRGYGIDTPAEVVPTGIELRQFHQEPGRIQGLRFRQRYAIDPERPLLVHVGRLAYEKNVEFLLRVLVKVKQSCPQVLLAIAGEGPARAMLEGLARTLGLSEQVRFLGYLRRDGTLEDCYSAGDAFIFASRTETQGLVLLESMALGTPVVSTAVMGSAEVLVQGEGCLIAEEDENHFAAQVLRVLNDAQLRQRLSERGLAYAKGWSAPALAERMLRFYQQVIDQGPSV